MVVSWRNERTTCETRVLVDVSGGPGSISVRTGRPFVDHVLHTVLFCAGWSGKITAIAEIDPDGHHTAEDVGYCLGRAVRGGLRPGYARYGWALVPMDDSLARVAVDLGGRAHCEFHLPAPCPQPTGWSWDMIRELWRAFSRAARATVHLDGLRGDSAHHLAEAMAKAAGMALGQAVVETAGVRSTKGAVD